MLLNFLNTILICSSDQKSQREMYSLICNFSMSLLLTEYIKHKTHFMHYEENPSGKDEIKLVQLSELNRNSILSTNYPKAAESFDYWTVVTSKVFPTSDSNFTVKWKSDVISNLDVN